MTSVAVFPAPSVAVTVIVLTPIASGTSAFQFGAMNVAVPLPPVAALDHATKAIPSASDAVPDRGTGEILVKYVAVATGPEIWTAGASVSRVTTIVAGRDT